MEEKQKKGKMGFLQKQTTRLLPESNNLPCPIKRQTETLDNNFDLGYFPSYWQILSSYISDVWDRVKRQWFLWLVIYWFLRAPNSLFPVLFSPLFTCIMYNLIFIVGWNQWEKGDKCLLWAEEPVATIWASVLLDKRTACYPVVRAKLCLSNNILFLM